MTMVIGVRIVLKTSHGYFYRLIPEARPIIVTNDEGQTFNNGDLVWCRNTSRDKYKQGQIQTDENLDWFKDNSIHVR